MIIRKTSSILVGLLILLSVSLNSNAAPIKSDFVFMIDATGSMAGEIVGVRAGFSTFVNNLAAEDIDARFAVIVFGGAAELTLDFTSDGVVAQTALNNITIGPNAGIQNNHNVNPEAGLEAIRMALGAATQSVLVNNNIPEDGILNYRDDARKNLILVTDEDSDRPFYLDNRFLGQNTLDPPGFPNAAWQAEVDATAQAVIDNNAFLNMLINVGDVPSKSQYGDYNKDVSDLDLLNYDPDATLAALLADPLTANSLQAQVLEADLIARSFNVAGANNTDFVNNFFNAKIEETIENPVCPDGSEPPCNGTVPVPEPSIIALFAAGLFGLGLARRRMRS